MKKIIWSIFTLLLLFSMAAVFGQDQKVVSTQKDETTLKSTDQTPQKVSEMRKVTVHKQQQAKPTAPVYKKGSSSAPVSATRQNTNASPNKKASTTTKEAQTTKKQIQPVIPKRR